MFETIHALVARAREHGAIRSDVTGTDVILLMCAPNYVAGYAPDASPDPWPGRPASADSAAGDAFPGRAFLVGFLPGVGDAAAR
jgi:hypothetical protein